VISGARRKLGLSALLQYVHVSAIALLLYEYLLTIELEVNLIWYSSWSYIKVLFLLTRYLPIFEIFVVIYDQLIPDVSEHVCAATYPLSTWLVSCTVNFTQVILAIRTWVVWNKDARVGIGLAVLLLGNLALQFVLLDKTNRSFQYFAGPYSGFRGCFLAGATKDLWVNWFVLVIVEGVIFALMAISAFRKYRSCGNTTLLWVIHRDSILFSAYVLCMAIANLIDTTVLPLDLATVLNPMAYAIYPILAVRIVFNIKSTGRSGITELDHPYPQIQAGAGIALADINMGHSRIVAASTPCSGMRGGSGHEHCDSEP